MKLLSEHIVNELRLSQASTGDRLNKPTTFMDLKSGDKVFYCSVSKSRRRKASKLATYLYTFIRIEDNQWNGIYDKNIILEDKDGYLTAMPCFSKGNDENGGASYDFAFIENGTAKYICATNKSRFDSLMK